MNLPRVDLLLRAKLFPLPLRPELIFSVRWNDNRNVAIRNTGHRVSGTAQVQHMNTFQYKQKQYSMGRVKGSVGRREPVKVYSGSPVRGETKRFEYHKLGSKVENVLIHVLDED